MLERRAGEWLEKCEKKIKKRPLLADLGAARKLYEKRLPQYRDLADIEVDVTGRLIEDVAEEIIDKLG